MKVLVIGGTGTISTYVVKKCLEMGMEVSIMNRGTHNDDVPNEVNIIQTDINQEEETKALLKDKHYDCVIDFVAFVPKHIERDVRLFKKITDQYIFISSASAYQKPIKHYPITEDTPLENPYWEYSRNKAACEAYLKNVKDLHYTIVRPSHTYDHKMLMAVMTRWGFEYAHIKRLLDGKPVIVPGDGTNLWTITHASDFANSFVYLIGNHKAYGQSYHITGDKVYTWDQLTELVAQALGVKANIIHIPSDVIIKHMPEMEGPLLGDKSWSAIFDNQKIKSISKNYTSLIGYEDVVDDVVAYYQAHQEKQQISASYEMMYDALIESYRDK